MPSSLGSHKYAYLIRKYTKPEEIKLFATCILKILKGKELPPDILKEKEKKDIFEFAGLIVTSEYFRGQQALSISFTEFYQLKYHPTLKRLKSMYKKPYTLLYPEKGGSQKIMNAAESVLKKSFDNMFDCYCELETINPIYSKLSSISQKQLREEFNTHKIHQLHFIYGIIDNLPDKIEFKYKHLAPALANQKMITKFFRKWHDITSLHLWEN